MGTTKITASKSGITSNEITLTVTKAILTSIAVTPTAYHKCGSDSAVHCHRYLFDNTQEDITANVIGSSSDTVRLQFPTPQVLKVWPLLYAPFSDITAASVDVTSNIAVLTIVQQSLVVNTDLPTWVTKNTATLNGTLTILFLCKVQMCISSMDRYNSRVKKATIRLLQHRHQLLLRDTFSYKFNWFNPLCDIQLYGKAVSGVLCIW
jgi:hypothetical protein